MRAAKLVLCLFGTLFFCATSRQAVSQKAMQNRRIVIVASMLLDGRGHVLRNTRVVVEGSKIVAVDPKAAPVTYDLRGLTVMPGWMTCFIMPRRINWPGAPPENAQCVTLPLSSLEST